MSIPLDEVVYFDVITNDPSSREPTDADSGVTYSVFEEATDTPILSAVAMTKRTSLTGHYRGTFTCSTANGFEVGKWYSVSVSAAVGGTIGKAIAKNFRVTLAEEEVGAVVSSLSGAGEQSVDDSVGAALLAYPVPTLAELNAPRVHVSAIRSGTVVDHASNSATTFDTDLDETADNHWRYPMCVILTSGALEGQLARLAPSGYDGTTKFLTFVSPGFTSEPAAGVTFDIINR